jgi:hypothetical protein
MSGYGLGHKAMAAILGISHETLRKHFGVELEMGTAMASLAVRQTLYQRAVKGEPWAVSLWIKLHEDPGDPPARLVVDGKVQHEHSGEIQVLTAEQRASVLGVVRARALAAAAAEQVGDGEAATAA